MGNVNVDVSVGVGGVGDGVARGMARRQLVRARDAKQRHAVSFVISERIRFMRSNKRTSVVRSGWMGNMNLQRSTFGLSRGYNDFVILGRAIKTADEARMSSDG